MRQSLFQNPERKNVLLCRRKISFILDKTSSEKQEMSKIKADSLYLVFMKLEWNKDYTKRFEKKRESIKIIFK